MDKNMENEKTLLLDADDACRVLNVGKNTLYRLVKEGMLPTVKWNKKVLIPRAALEKMLSETGNK